MTNTPLPTSASFASTTSNAHHHPRPFDDHIYHPTAAQPGDQDDEQDQQQVEMDAGLQRHLTRVQVVTPLAILLNLTSLVVCSILVYPNLDHVNETHITQFTPNPKFILLYWAIVFLLQVGFAILIVAGQKEFTKRTIVYGVGVRLAIANVLLGAWAITFVVNNPASLMAGFILIAINGLLLLITALLLAVKYPPSTSRPLDWLFIHVPVKMFLAITVQNDIPQMLFIALGWYDKPGHSDQQHTDIRAIWPSFGILAGVGALSAIWIFAASDVTWAVAGIYLYFAMLYSKTPTLHQRRPEIVAAIILAMILQAVALIGSLLYKWLASIQNEQDQNNGPEGRIALGRNPREEAAAARQEAEAEAAAAAARERALASSSATEEVDQVEDDIDAAKAKTSTQSHQNGHDDPNVLERGEADNVKVSRRLGSSTS